MVVDTVETISLVVSVNCTVIDDGECGAMVLLKSKVEG